MSLERIVDELGFPEPIFVTRPTMPSFEDYSRLLGDIWERGWLTNQGEYHQILEKRLAEYIGVEHLILFCNGTLALLVALQALRINSGEVITTPFTFPATPHVLYWNGIRPVFCDIDPKTYNLDANRIEESIGPDTKAILPVHVYGTPCDIDSIQEIADRHGLHVIYDAAHTFGARYKGASIAAAGDASMLSFHATKLFSTGEGGALIVKTEAEKRRVNSLKNFGITGEETVIGPGINGKMNEFQAAYGILHLEMIEEEISCRHRLACLYTEGLEGVTGVSCLREMPEVQRNYAYFPIFVDAQKYGMSRDMLHSALKRFNVITRKYFYPLCSRYSCYAALPSSRPERLPVAERAAQEVLCLPIYGKLDPEIVTRICQIITALEGEDAVGE